MSRTIVVTGAGSGIGKATAQRLRDGGHQVIGVDLKGSDIDADLSTPAGIGSMVDAVRERADGRIDGVIANAGSAAQEAWIVKINYFGAVRTIEGLRPLLQGSDAPRVSITSSMASFHPTDDAIIDACLADHEDGAITAAQAAVDRDEAGMIYASSKRAITRWMRSVAASDAYAGAGIPINAVGPGVIVTPMTEPLLATEEGREQIRQGVPMPLHGHGRPEHIAAIHDFLMSPDNALMTGQMLFADGGADVVMRGQEAF